MTGTHSEEHEQQPKQSNRINAIAIIAGALASLSAAVVASFFGVAGTLIGTAVVSVVSSLAAAVYAGLLGRTHGLVQRGTSTVLQVLPDRVASHHGPASDGAPGRQEPSKEPEAPGDRAPSGARWAGGARAGLPPRRWLVIGGLAVLIFAIAIGALTGIEAAIKEPIASAIGVRDRGQARTSVGVAVDRASGSETAGTSPSSPSSSTPPQAPPPSSQPGQAPPTIEPGPSTTGSTQPPSTTAPPTTTPAQPSTPPASGGSSGSH